MAEKVGGFWVEQKSPDTESCPGIKRGITTHQTTVRAEFSRSPPATNDVRGQIHRDGGAGRGRRTFVKTEKKSIIEIYGG